jgi:hypothetical protein
MTAVVFAAEMIIAYTLVKKLLEIDKLILQTNDTLTEIKPGLRDVEYLIKKISAQLVELSYDFVAKIRKKRDDSIMFQLNKIIIAILLIRFNSKFIRKIMRSKHFRLLSKGLSLLKYMV